MLIFLLVAREELKPTTSFPSTKGKHLAQSNWTATKRVVVAAIFSLSYVQQTQFKLINMPKLEFSL